MIVRKASRTISGVTPVAVMAKPFPCPGQCVYCPDSPEAPKSYTPESPAVLRARGCDFDAKKQVEARLRALGAMGHAQDKVELIVMGGTFLSYPRDYQYAFIKGCYDALNRADSENLEEARRLNEQSAHRCVGLCIETRPDFCGEEQIRSMLDFGTTRVELGVQTLDDEIHLLTRRGHGVAEVVCATRALRNTGFKVHYHWMPGLPGSTRQHDLELARILFEDGRFRPDGLKLYPTLVVQGSELETWFRDGRYRPYRDDDMIDLLIDIKTRIPGYVRISRLMRDIPAKFIIAGSKDLALRGTIRKRMEQRGLRCSCIRCREYGHRLRDGWQVGEPQLTRLEYQTPGGREIFLSYEDEDKTLFGLLRLRLCGEHRCATEPTESLVEAGPGGRSRTRPDSAPDTGARALPGRDNRAIIRELHVFGPEVPIGGRMERAAQHRGLGERLLEHAERIARKEFGADTLLVLSGIGAREYYRALGYGLDGAYMCKKVG